MAYICMDRNLYCKLFIYNQTCLYSETDQLRGRWLHSDISKWRLGKRKWTGWSHALSYWTRCLGHYGKIGDKSHHNYYWMLARIQSKGKGKGLWSCSRQSLLTASHDFTIWLDMYIPAPSPLPGEHYIAAIIDAG